VASNKFINDLKRIFKISDVKSSQVSNEPTVHPGYVDPKTNKLKPVKFPDEIQELYNFFLRDTFENSETLKNRMDRYSSLLYAYYNNAIFSKAVNLYADETVQSDVNNQIIGVEAKKPVQNYIYDFLNKIGVTADILHETAFNIVLFGDSFWVNSIDSKEKTIADITPIEVKDVKDRIEFNASQVNKRKQQYQNFSSYIQKDSKLRAIAKILDDSAKDQDYSQYFRNYLFGFWLGQKMYLAPWNVSHFRMFTTVSEFFPFGRPLMINALAPFRQLQAGKNLMAMARAQNFPIKHFEVAVDENMDQSDQWEAVNEAREEWANLGASLTEKEQFAINSEIWTPEGLINLDIKEPRLNLDDIADIELLRDELIMATDIPKGYLIVDRSSFGTSGQALLRQHKPFARAVYKVQSTILKQLTQLIRMQFVISEEYDYDTDFELTMPFPEIEESSDRLRIKNDTLRLAKDILDNIGDAVGLERGEALPPDIVKDILGKFSFMDRDDVDEWIDDIMKTREQEPEEPQDGEGSGFMFDNYERTRNKLKERLKPSTLYECYFNAKRSNNLLEHSMAGKHYYNASIMDDQEKLMLELMRNEKQGKRLKE
jgi:hypothetical protein